jgi:hypothetical protein
VEGPELDQPEEQGPKRTEEPVQKREQEPGPEQEVQLVEQMLKE